MADAPPATIAPGAVASANGRIAWVGRQADVPPHLAATARETIRCGGAWLTPGFIDCHTHIVFGGDRTGDFRRRLQGESYADIARTGGGILSTVAATRRVSNRQLTDAALARARELASWGVTTIEIKSGYGLDIDTELRMLRVAAKLGRTLPVDISPTLLLHGVPPQYAARRADYVRLITNELIPAAIAQGHATAIDVFCETIAFTRDETRRIVKTGIEAGLHGHLHADQLSDQQGGALAARVGARSADHLEYLAPEGIAAMAKAKVCAVLLPGAAYTLGADRRPPVTALREAGVTMAVATDANPGSSPITHMGLVLNLACLRFGLTPEEALRGVTACAAKVLALDADRGAIAPGLRADFAIWDVDDLVQLCYWIGPSPLKALVKDGIPVDFPRCAVFPTPSPGAAPTFPPL